MREGRYGPTADSLLGRVYATGQSIDAGILMKKEFVVDPLNGVGLIRLGASRETVLGALGTPATSFYKTPNSRYPTDTWFENGFQVFYEGDQPMVAFIELSNGHNFEAVLFGLPVFATAAPVLVREVGRRAKLDETDPELGYAYIFPSLELAFWRPDNDDKEASYFSTLGIGVLGYFAASGSACCSILNKRSATCNT